MSRSAQVLSLVLCCTVLAAKAHAQIPTRRDSLAPRPVTARETSHNTFPDSGRVGIGTMLPTAALHVRHGSVRVQAVAPSLTLAPIGAGYSTYSLRAGRSADPAQNGTQFLLRNETTGRDVFAMHHDGHLELGLGSNVPRQHNHPPAVLDVRAVATRTSARPLAFVARFTNAAPGGSGVTIQSGSESSEPREILRLSPFDAPPKWIFLTDGRLIDLSDAGLKSEIRPIENALERMADIRGVSFEWSSGGGGRQIGLIAQQVESAFPELVHEAEGVKGVAYTRFTGVLVEAIHELRAELEATRRENAEMRAQLEAIEAAVREVKQGRPPGE